MKKTINLLSTFEINVISNLIMNKIFIEILISIKRYCNFFMYIHIYIDDYINFHIFNINRFSDSNIENWKNKIQNRILIDMLHQFFKRFVVKKQNEHVIKIFIYICCFWTFIFQWIVDFHEIKMKHKSWFRKKNFECFEFDLILFWTFFERLKIKIKNHVILVVENSVFEHCTSNWNDNESD